MIRVDGQLYDIPKCDRIVTRFTSEQRSDMMAAHTQGWRQRSRVMEINWAHPFCPGVCFRTKPEAYRAALRTLAVAK